MTGSAKSDISITTRVGKKGESYRYRIWDPIAQTMGAIKTFSVHKYGSKKAAHRAGTQWAKDILAREQLGLDEVSNMGAATCSLAEVITLRCKELTSNACHPVYIQQVRIYLKGLIEWCPDLAHPKAPKQLADWWRHIKSDSAHNWSIRSKNAHLIHLKGLLNFAYDFRAYTGLKRRVDVDFLKRLAQPHTIKEQFSIEELRTMLASSDPFGLQAALYIYTGARLYEALTIRWAHVNFQSGLILLRGKSKGAGFKERYVTMQPELHTLLMALKTDGHREHGQKEHGYQGASHDSYGRVRSDSEQHDFIFPHELQSREHTALNRDMNRFLANCGIPKNKRTTHSIRHTWAAIMTASGVPTARLMADMGHTDPKMTAHYAQLARVHERTLQSESWEMGVFSFMQQADTLPTHKSNALRLVERA